MENLIHHEKTESQTEATTNEEQENLPPELMQLLEFYGEGDPSTVKKPGYIEYSKAPGLNGKEITRAQIGISSNGCEHLRKVLETTGLPSCYMFCDFAKVASTLADIRGRSISPIEMMGQVEKAIEAINENGNKPQRIELYTGGSLLNEEELTPETLETMYRDLAKSDVKEITLEGRVTDLTPEKLEWLNKLAEDTKTKAIIALGIESTDIEILKRIKKGIGPQGIEKGIKAILEKPNLVPQAYLLIKPIIMSDQAAIKRTLDDLKFLKDAVEKFRQENETQNKKKVLVNMAPIFPKRGTGSDIMEGYKAANLWSIIELIENIPPETLEYLNLYFGLNTEDSEVPEEISKITEKVTSCNECEEELLAAIKEFNKTHETDHLKELQCDCRNKYEAEKNPPFITSWVTAPNNSDNPDPYEEAVFQDQLDCIMNIEKSSYDENEGQATRQEMECRLRKEGNYTLINYGPDGEPLAYYMTNILRADDIERLPPTERGWDQCKKLPVVPVNEGGNIAHAISIAAKEEASSGAALSMFYRILDEVVLANNLEGGIGISRMPGLVEVKEKVETELGIKLAEEDIFELGEQYLQAHFERFKEEREKGDPDNGDFKLKYKIGEKEIEVNHSIDGTLRFEGRILFPERGIVVKSMKNDPQSCHLGATYQPSRKHLAQVKELIAAILQMEQ